MDPHRPAWLAYEVMDDETIASGRVFFDAKPWTRSRPGRPDGPTVDGEGNLFAAGPGGVFIFAPDATLLGIIETGVATAVYRISLHPKATGV